jgi:hypothetical protein
MASCVAPAVSTDIAYPPLVVQGGTGTACQSVRFRQPISCVPGLRPTARIYLLASLGCHATKGVTPQQGLSLTRGVEKRPITDSQPG